MLNLLLFNYFTCNSLTNHESGTITIWLLRVQLLVKCNNILTWGISKIDDIQAKIWNNLLVGLELFPKPWDLDKQL